jgi:hypothetical protein
MTAFKAGQIYSAVGLIAEGRAKTQDEIRELMSGNVCRAAAIQTSSADGLLQRSIYERMTLPEGTAVDVDPKWAPRCSHHQRGAFSLEWRRYRCCV